eukprot:498287_1
MTLIAILLWLMLSITYKNAISIYIWFFLLDQYTNFVCIILTYQCFDVYYHRFCKCCNDKFTRILCCSTDVSNHVKNVKNITIEITSDASGYASNGSQVIEKTNSFSEKKSNV